MPAPAPAVVDVALPCYGTPTYLDETLRCVFAQTYPHWRLWVIDNSDGEEIREVAEPYLADPRASYRKTGGLNQAQNWTAAVHAGSAPYVVLLCDDDGLDPEWMAHRVPFLEAHPECRFVFSAWREVDGRGALIREIPHRFDEGLIQPQQLVPQLYERNPIGISSILVRRAAYDEVGGSFTERVRNIDREMWMRMAVRGPVGYVRHRDCYYRLHEATLTSRSGQHGAELLATLDAYDEVIAGRGGLAVSRELRGRRRAAAHVGVALDALEAGDRTVTLRHLRRAARVHLPTLLDPRFATTLVAALTGEPGRRALGRLREVHHRRRLPLHLRTVKFKARDTLLHR